MKLDRISPNFAIPGLLALLGGIALTGQDRYSLQVPGGLAFSEFRGYQDWQTVAVSRNGDKVAIILGNPEMIEAYKTGIPGNGKPFLTARGWRRFIGWRRRMRNNPASR